MPSLSEDNSLGSNFTEPSRCKLIVSLRLSASLSSSFLDSFISNVPVGLCALLVLSLLGVLMADCLEGFILDWSRPPGARYFCSLLSDPPSCAWLRVDLVGMVLQWPYPLGQVLGCWWTFFLRGIVAVNHLFKRPIGKNANVVTIILFAALVNYYHIDDLFFYEKHGEDLINNAMRSDIESVPDFPICIVLVDECRNQLALHLDAAAM